VYDDSSREIRASASAANVIVSQSTRTVVEGDAFTGQAARVLAAKNSNNYATLHCNGTMKFIGDGAVRYDNIVTGSSKYFPDGPNQTVFVSGLYPSTGWSCDNSLIVSGTDAPVTYTVDGKTDIMYAAEKETKLYEDPPTLTFEHLLTLLKIQLVKVGNADITVNSITLVGVGSDGDGDPLPVHTKCAVPLNSGKVNFSKNDGDTEIDCFKMDGSTYTDDPFTGYALTTNPNPNLKAYVLAPALKKNEVDTDKDYTFSVIYTLGTGEPTTVPVTLQLTTDGTKPFDASTAGTSFVITLCFTAGDITTKAEIDPWDDDGKGFHLTLIPGKGPTPQSPTGTIDGMSNCYIVTPGETLSFAVSRAYKYNTDTNTFTNELHIGDNYTGEFTAAVLWEDPDVINGTPSVSGNGPTATLALTTHNTSSGNAVVAIKKKNTDAIVWSYHIWVTNYNPDDGGATWTNPNNADYTFMDRNLGATTTSTLLGSFGLFYQWGRKDPFPGGESGTAGYSKLTEFSGLPGSKNTNQLTVTNKTASVDGFNAGIIEAITKPLTFFSTLNLNTSGWLPFYTDTLWNSHDDKKTIYDPCPDGWQVPVYLLKKNNSKTLSTVIPWAGICSYFNTVKTGADYAVAFAFNNGYPDFPLAGYRYGNSGSYQRQYDTYKFEIGTYWMAGTWTNDAVPVIIPPPFIEAKTKANNYPDAQIVHYPVKYNTSSNYLLAGEIGGDGADARSVRCCKEFALK
jgi:hypothetical protein